MLHAAGPPGHFVPVWVDLPGNAGGQRIREEEPEVPGETKAERTRRLARNRKVRAANRLAAETPQQKKARTERERAAQRRAEGKHEQNQAARSQKTPRRWGA